MGYLDGNGLAYLWGKINAALGKKQDAASAVTMEQVNGAIQTAVSAGGGGSTGGAPGEIYSTQEQVVGRWIDDKPLYRKTIVETGVDLYGNVIQCLVYLQDCEIRNWHGYIENGYDRFPLNFNASRQNDRAEYFLLTYLGDFGQSLMLHSGGSFEMYNATTVATVEYTKTTD